MVFTCIIFKNQLIISTFLQMLLIRNGCALLDELTCKPVIPPVEISQPKMTQLLKFIQSQQITPKLLEDVTVTEIEDFKKAQHDQDNNEDIHMTIIELANKYGYDMEEYKVETKDGYILTMHRIPGDGEAVFLMHGVFGASDDWIVAGPDSALAYILASAGYDVWIGNARGNKHSKKHVTKSPEYADFWDFSWDEIGRYDLPVMIDFVLDRTNKCKLFYVGYSQGTTSFFVMASELPEYNDKIILMVALSPVAFTSHVKSPAVRLIALETGLAYSFAAAIGTHELASNEVVTNALTDVVCGNNVLAKFICASFANVLVGCDRGQLNVTNLPVIMGHFPSGTSAKQLIHYAQGIESAKFRRFDYGEDVNKEKYDNAVPPDYPVEKIYATVAMFYSNADWFANITDISILRDKLQNVVEFHLVDHYSHMDYQWATNIKELIYDRILKLFTKYSQYSCRT